MISSEHECAGILSAAKKALGIHGKFWLGNAKIEDELVALDLLTKSERFMAIDLVLDEIRFKDYQGPAPPNDICAHPPFKGTTLYAFCWTSTSLSKRMYFKFSLAKGSGPTQLAVYSLHEPRN